MGRDVAAGRVLEQIFQVLVGSGRVRVVEAYASEESPDGGDRLFGRAQIGAVPGGLQQHERAVRQLAVDVFADRSRRDHVLRALEDRLRAATPSRSRAIVGQERRAGEPLGDLRVRAAEAVGEFLASSGRSALPMMTGAIACDQPIWLLSRNSSNSWICASLKPPT